MHCLNPFFLYEKSGFQQSSTAMADTPLLIQLARQRRLRLLADSLIPNNDNVGELA
jgi:hypothetical protein